MKNDFLYGTRPKINNYLYQLKEMRLKYSEIAQVLDSNLIGDDGVVENFKVDSREIVQGRSKTCFIAFEGKQSDGHMFISSLLAKGVNFFILSNITYAPSKGSYILVNNVLEALQQLAAEVRNRTKAEVIGITGSNGKTLAKDALVHLLSKSGLNVVSSPRSYNSQLGVALSLLQIKEDTDIAIIEAGISQKGEMAKLARMIKPDIGILTHVGDRYSRAFDSIEEKIKEKCTLFIDSKIVFCNSANPAKSVIESLGLNFKIIDIVTGLTEKHNEILMSDVVENNLNLAMAVAGYLNLEGKTLKNLALSWKPTKNRISFLEGSHNSIIIDDSYTNDMEALAAAAKLCKKNAEGRKLVAIVTALEGEQGGSEVKKVLQDIGYQKIYCIGKGFDGPFYDSVKEFLKEVDTIDFRNNAILVKGLRKYGLSAVVHFLQSQKNVSTLQINLDKLKQNYQSITAEIENNVKVLLMLKAEAYGSGLHRWAQIIKEIKPSYIGVAHVDEGVLLRKMGVEIPILVLYSSAEDLDTIAIFNLEPLVYSFSFFNALNGYQDTNIKYHIELDTGMHRLGIMPIDVQRVLDMAKESMHQLVGVMSHLSSADEPAKDDFTLSQIAQFTEFTKRLEQELKVNTIKHICNSQGTKRFPQAHFDMVRLGIGIFGLSSPDTNVLILETKIAQVKDLKAFEGVGYGNLEAQNVDRKIAILPIGYADGFDRGLGNGNWSIEIQGKMCPTVGNVCMDMCMVDVSTIDTYENQKAVLFGPNNGVNKMAKALGTIPYEIISRLSSRIKRIYVKE